MRWTFVFAGWGLLLALIAAAGELFFGFPDWEEYALFGAAVATMAILAAVVWPVDERADGLRVQADVSLPVPWVGVAVALVAYGFEVGWWLTLIAGAMLLSGLIALVRERRADRQALRRARQQAAWEGRLR
jgi:hypothetical protein